MTDSLPRPHVTKLRVLFCGGCNPQIDRAGLAAALFEDPTLTEGKKEVTVHLSGCSRACASGHELTLEGTAAVVVAGECLDGHPAAVGTLAEIISRKLKE
jgi:sulfite reductase beta subunit-like hemoprotein